MPVNAALEGHTYKLTQPQSVSEDDLVAFARAVRATGAVHLDSEAAREAGYAGVIATPTFAVTVAQKAEALFMQDPEASVDYSRLVHGEETFNQHAAIVAGDELLATTTVRRIRSVGGNDMVTLATEVFTADGEKRTSTTSTVVIRGEG